MLSSTERVRLRVTGTVQGVGFRPFVYRLARDLGLGGSVANDSRGVVVEVEGRPQSLDAFRRRLRQEAPPLARIATVDVETLAATGDRDFRIFDSRAAGAPAVAVSVDVATCADCQAELSEPADRRFEYPFVNCTNCGPRYTIIRSIPYDRAATTMAGFVMCHACQREYEDPSDRRFHAEPNACAVCGPQLSLLATDGQLLGKGGDALDLAAEALLAGRILAVKGLGGYHLAVDATDAAAVAELRRQKARDDKPFAVMAPDAEAARGLCELSPAAEEALTSPRRPIVLAPRRDPEAPAPGVAPNLPELGVMLPYTPLHHLLLARVARPLVMTSGNLSDEPIAHDDDDALDRLGPMAHAVLTHNRAIHIRCDDSVIRALPAPGGTLGPERPNRAGGTGPERPNRAGSTGPGRDRVQMVRRSRGYAPEPVPLLGRAQRQVLAVGAELKNTVAVAKGDNVIASHHIGDLEHLAAYRSFLQAVAHLCSLTGVFPEVVAHDLHPEYLSTKFALEQDLPTVGIQHHHAHIAACLIEHAWSEPVLGIAFDGLGLGDDDTLWGGEFLVADLAGSRRVGHLRPVPLPGGTRAIREPWRMALAWTRLALGREAAERYGASADDRWPAVLALIERPDTLTTTSAGRLFDAVAALVGVRAHVTYEAQAAIELEALAATAGPDDDAAYPVGTAVEDGRLVLDPAPLIAGVVADHAAGMATGRISSRFHASLGAAVARSAVALAREHGLTTAALSGGVFQNARLTEIVARALTGAGLAVLVHEHLTPNDGSISIGQAAIASR